MKHSDFKIGTKFTCGRRKWLCTDVGSRTIAAVCLTVCRANDWARGLPEAQQEEAWQQEGEPEVDPSWLKGPPYALAENIFDENDITGCEVIP